MQWRSSLIGIRAVSAFVCSLSLLAAACAGESFIQPRSNAEQLTQQGRPSLDGQAHRGPVPLGNSGPAQRQALAISLHEALRMALSKSEIVRVANGSSVEASTDTFYNLEIAEAKKKAVLAAFDTSFEASFYNNQFKQPPDSFFGPGLAEPSERSEAAFHFGFSKRWITGGKTSILYNPSPGYLFIPDSDDGFNPRYVGELEFTVTQPLLRGAGIGVNRAPIEIRQVSASQSAWEFKKAVMSSVRSVITEYWEYYAAQIALKSINEVIPFLEEVVRIQEASFKAKWVIYADVAKAYGQLHLFRQERLELESELASRELRLRHLLGLPPDDGCNLLPTTNPTNYYVDIDIEHALDQAMSNQPDLARQRLAVKIRELELLVARNGVKPNLDLSVIHRMNGVGEDISTALSQLFTAEFSDLQFRATLEMPIGRRQARAELLAAELSLARDNGLLQEELLAVAHQVRDDLRRVDYSYREYQEAKKRWGAAEEWLKGSRLRYQNPLPKAGNENWLLQRLNEYLSALRFRTDAATGVAKALAQYNSDLVRLEESKGTILSFFGIDFVFDPCRQTQIFPAGTMSSIPPVVFGPLPTGQTTGLPPALERLPPVDGSAPAPIDCQPNPQRLPQLAPPEVHAPPRTG